MKPNVDPERREKPLRKSVRRKSMGDVIAHGLASTLAGFLTGLCRLFLVNPENLKKPGERGNTPPPTGGISSLG